MQKIPTLFVRDPDNLRYVTREANPACEWVFAGEGIARRKYDGTCVLLDRSGSWWARREVKPGKTPPAGFTQIDEDPVTGKTVGWEPATQSSFYRWLREAVDHAGTTGEDLKPGTYEICGPKINKNPEGFAGHVLIYHADAEELPAPSYWDGLRAYLHSHPYEGIVWHHPDGRMAKIKRRDFVAVTW